MRLARWATEQMIEHAREAAPLECVGLLGGRDGRVTHVLRAENLEECPGRFSLSYVERKRLLEALVHDRLDLLAVYHSHPGTDPYPSGEDLRGCDKFYESIVHLIVSLSEGEPVIRAFRIRGKNVVEEEIDEV